MKIPKTFMPEKDLEKRTEELTEGREIKPHLDPDISAVNEVLEEIRHNPKYYYDSQRFHQYLYAALIQSNYSLLRQHGMRNTYLYKKNSNNQLDLFIQVYKETRRHYYFAVAKPQHLGEFVTIFDEHHSKGILSQHGFRKALHAYLLGYGSGMGSYLTYQLITDITNTPRNVQHQICSMAAGACIGVITHWLLKRHKLKKNEEKLKLSCEELVTDEREAIKRALS